MARHSTLPRIQRFLVLVTVIVLHALLFALIITARSKLPSAPARPSAMLLVSIEADKTESPAKPPPPQMPSPRSEKLRPAPEPFVAFDPDSQSTSAATGGACAPLEVVATSLLADPTALEAVHNAPRETRSISDAIVMWNEGWSDAASLSEAPLGAVRAVVERSLSALPPECLEPVIAGPRLVPIADGEGTRFLVFGSGDWAWKQLLSDPLLGAPNAFPTIAPAAPAPLLWWQVLMLPR